MGQAFSEGTHGLDGWCSRCGSGSPTSEAITLERSSSTEAKTGAVIAGFSSSEASQGIGHLPDHAEAWQSVEPGGGKPTEATTAGPSACRSLYSSTDSRFKSHRSSRRGSSQPPALFVRPCIQGVPFGDDPGDAAEAAAALQAFAQVLIAGTGLRLALDGLGSLVVEALLSEDLSMLTLLFNSVERRIPLASVRSVHAERGAGGSQAEGKQEAISWQVRLDLEDGQFCTFIFDGDEEGRQQAAFFSRCLGSFVQSSRFEALKADLESGPQVRAAMDGDAGRLSMCSAPPDNDDSFDLHNADAIRSALLALPRLSEKRNA